MMFRAIPQSAPERSARLPAWLTLRGSDLPGDELFVTEQATRHDMLANWAGCVPVRLIHAGRNRRNFRKQGNASQL